MKQKTIFLVAIVLFAALFAGAVQMYRSQQAQQAAQRAAQNMQLLARMHAPSLGPVGARVHIVEFLDPACETCAAFYPLVKQMMAANPADIRLTVRYAPFHQGSDQVVMALEASRKQGKYWQALETLLGAQGAWVQNHRARPELIWAPLARAGLDIERLRVDMQAPEIARIVAQDLADAKTLNVTKTPEYFVNGRPLPSFGFEQLRDLVQEQLQSAPPKP